jgi:hypothetical protein
LGADLAAWKAMGKNAAQLGSHFLLGHPGIDADDIHLYLSNFIYTYLLIHKEETGQFNTNPTAECLPESPRKNWFIHSSSKPTESSLLTSQCSRCFGDPGQATCGVAGRLVPFRN